jgi:acetoin utilization deacetylase AcuC-like enzyme
MRCSVRLPLLQLTRRRCTAAVAASSSSSSSSSSPTTAATVRGLAQEQAVPPPPPGLAPPTLLLCPAAACARHRPAPLSTHPETSSRAAAIAGAVRRATVEQQHAGDVQWVGDDAEEVPWRPLSLRDPIVRRVHTDRHVAALTHAFEALRLFPEGLGPPRASAPTFGTGTEAEVITWDNTAQADRRAMFYFDTDTPAALGTEDAVLAAAGTALGAVDAVVAGEATNAFCITRPPGHHAEADRAMGFCFLNNAALAAVYALESREIDR